MYKLLLIFKFLFDKKIPLKEKWWIIIPLIYILSPVDLIPMPILGFGVLDDLLMLIFLLTIVFDKTKKYIMEAMKVKITLKKKILLKM